MRILLWNDNRNNAIYFGQQIEEDLRGLGHEVFRLEGDCFAKLYNKVIHEKHDLLLIEGGRLFPVDILKALKGKIWIFARWRWYSRYEVGSIFDYLDGYSTVANNEICSRWPSKALYSPPGALSLFFNNKTLSSPKYYTNISFIGRIDDSKEYKNRREMLKSPMVTWWNFASGKFKYISNMYDYATIVKSSKISLNVCSFDSEINQKVVDSMIIGIPVLSDTNRAMREMFIPGKHYIEYKAGDRTCMEETAKYYLENYDSAMKIAKRAQEEVLTHHTMKHRIEDILKKI